MLSLGWRRRHGAGLCLCDDIGDVRFYILVFAEVEPADHPLNPVVGCLPGLLWRGDPIWLCEEH